RELQLLVLGSGALFGEKAINPTALPALARPCSVFYDGSHRGLPFIRTLSTNNFLRTLLSEQREAFLAAGRGIILIEIRQLRGEFGYLLPQIRCSREHPALRVGFVQLGIIVGHGSKNRRAE